MDVISDMEGTIDRPGELVVFTEGLVRDLPPILTSSTSRVEERVEQFFLAVARIFDAWVARRSSKHTQRAYLRRKCADWGRCSFGSGMSLLLVFRVVPVPLGVSFDVGPYRLLRAIRPLRPDLPRRSRAGRFLRWVARLRTSLVLVRHITALS